MGVLSLVVGLASGCAATGEARYVYQDGQFGVVGIPRNTSHWPTNYRKHAEELMAQHFPEGYEIVRAEEVIEGSRVLTTNGSGVAEVGPALPLPLMKIGTIGLASSKNQADSVKIKECRILYKKAEHPGAPRAVAFAEQASLSPTSYLDPNALARKQAEKSEKPAEDKPTALAANSSEPAKKKPTTLVDESND
jgi:hypothetical protein